MAHFSYYYKSKIHSKISKHFLDGEIYKETLKKMLDLYSEEDANNHGRLIELKDLFLNLDDQVPEISEDEKMKFCLNDLRCFKKLAEKEKEEFEDYRKNFRYYQNWEKLYYEQNDMRIQLEILPKIRDEILNKKGIFESEGHYKLLEENFLIFEKKLNGVESSLKGSQFSGSSLGSFQYSKTHPLKFLQFEYGQGNQEKNRIKSAQNFYNYEEKKFFFNGVIYYYDYNFSENWKLREYYHKLERDMRSFFIHSNFSNEKYFFPKKISKIEKFKKLCLNFPSIRDIITEYKLDIYHLEEENFEKALENISKISDKFSDFPSSLAKAFVVTRRDYIMNLEIFSYIEQQKYGLSFLDSLLKKNYSIVEVMAILDAKLIECICIKFALRGYFDPLYFPKVKIFF